MEYLNIIILILIFIVLLVVFYLVISNFGVVSSNQNQDIEKKVNGLKNELSNIKNTLGIASPETNSQFIKFNSNIVPFPGESYNTKNDQVINDQVINDQVINDQVKNDQVINDQVKEIIIDTDVPIVNPIVNTNDLTSSSPSCPDNMCTKPPPVIYDPIANYDIAKLTDPLVDPRGRTSADQIPTPQVAAQFNFPTQGVLDRYHRVGLLIAIGSNVKKENIDKTNKFGLPYKESDNSDSDTEFVWEGNNKMGKSKKSKSKSKSKGKKYVSGEVSGTNNLVDKSYRGVEIKENFESDSDSYYGSDSDSMEYFGNTDKNVTNIYNVYSNQNDNNILELIGKKITDNWYKYFTSITMGNKVIKVVVRNKNRRELYSGDIVFIPEIGKTYRVKIDPMDMIEYNPYMF
jgi:hypothetical protein